MNHQAFIAAGILVVSLFPVPQAIAKDREHLGVAVDTTRLGAPPDATRAKDDLAIVLSIQTDRTPEREKEAIADAKQSLSRFLEGMGAKPDKDELKKARRLFKEATTALEDALAPMKGRFERPRPFQASAAVKPCATNLPTSSSFPSTHAGTGVLFSALLIRIAPERKTELEARGFDYGWSRVVCGFHYPSDVEAGRMGGHLVAEALLDDPAFGQRLARIAPALRRALGL